MRFEESSHLPNQTEYRLTLRESPPPPPPPDPLGGIDDSLLDAAGDFVDGVTDVLDTLDALANIPDFSDPSSLLGGTLDDASSAIGGLADIGGALGSLFGDE